MWAVMQSHTSSQVEAEAVVSFDPLYFCVVCCDLSIFISSFIDLIFLPCEVIYDLH